METQFGINTGRAAFELAILWCLCICSCSSEFKE